jgi:short-subunit dehydrogenase
MKDLHGRTVLLTGAAGGMGRQFATQLMELGCRVILTDYGAAKLRHTAREILEGDRAFPGSIAGLIEADLAGPQGCTEIFEKAGELAGDVDILINNAGTITYGDFHEVPPERWEGLMQVNLLAPMRLTHLFLPGMLSRGRGHLVFMSSVAGFIPTSQGTPYSCSKFGLRGFGMGLWGEVRTRGIDVTCVYPWWVMTDLLKSPEFGTAQVGRLPLPGLLADRPERVVREIVTAMRKGRLHCYPGIFAKGAWMVSRIVPLISRQAH